MRSVKSKVLLRLIFADHAQVYLTRSGGWVGERSHQQPWNSSGFRRPEKHNPWPTRMSSWMITRYDVGVHLSRHSNILPQCPGIQLDERSKDYLIDSGAPTEGKPWNVYWHNRIGNLFGIVIVQEERDQEKCRYSSSLPAVLGFSLTTSPQATGEVTCIE